MSGRRPTRPLWLLVPVTTWGTLAMHILVPALPALAMTLAAAAGTSQLAITLYLVGLALGQQVYGPLSDRFGRRPTLLARQLLYVAAASSARLPVAARCSGS